MKIKGFKNFKVEKIDEKVINKVIAQSFKLKSREVDILQDYLENDEELFEELNGEKF